jgi:hypothetical protein
MICDAALFYRFQTCHDAPERYEKYLLELKQQLIHERASH